MSDGLRGRVVQFFQPVIGLFGMSDCAKMAQN